VFIADTEEELIPHKKSIDTSPGAEEERRLFYVGIPRAINKLL
jgi:DNA helicase-2/ATP-dependent DNA helicase PcrA